jgi:xanthine dehydrogenase/oxidase
MGGAFGNSDQTRDTLEFWVNGEHVALARPDPSQSLASYLRDTGLTGTKLSCGQGGCGACSVILSRSVKGRVEHQAVNACIRPLVSCDGAAITTTEGLGNSRDGLDAVQASIALHNGTQCGFCTPGFVTTARALLANHPAPTREDVEDWFAGNLCRCTGYRPILHAMRQFCPDRESADTPLECIVPDECPVTLRTTPAELRPTPERIKPSVGTLRFERNGRTWFRPTSLPEAQRLHAELSRSGRKPAFIAGATSQATFVRMQPRACIDVSALPELTGAELSADGVRVGAAVSIERLIALCEQASTRESARRASVLEALAEQAKQIAGVQVRSVGTIGGNVILALLSDAERSPFVSDLLPLLTVSGTRVAVHSATFDTNPRWIELADLHSRATLPDDALIAEFEIPVSAPTAWVRGARVARKSQMSSAVVNAAFHCTVDADRTIAPDSIHVAFGGLAPGLWRPQAVARALSGRGAPDALSVIADFRDELRDLSVTALPTEASAMYRRGLAVGLMYKFLLELSQAHVEDRRNARDCSAVARAKRPLSSTRYSYPNDLTREPVSLPFVKAEAFAQAAGEVRFTFDEPLAHSGLHAAVIGSDRAHAKFRFDPPLPELEARLREEFSDFETLVTASDIPGSKMIGPGNDDPLFYEGEVRHHGARIGLALARTRATAVAAARYVGDCAIVYDDLPAVVTFDDAIARGETLPNDEGGAPRVLLRPGTDVTLFDVGAELPDGAHAIGGAMRTGAQAHFGMEMRSSLATPGKYGEMHIWNGTQWPTGEQAAVASVLGVPVNHVTIQVNQLGGGFGSGHHGSTQFATMAAVAAHKTRRQIRLATDRQQNMQLIGKRHPFHGDYRTVFRTDGTILGLDLSFSAFGGATRDCSWEVLDLAQLLSDNCYYVPNLRVTVRALRSNVTTNTAFRSFGQAQSHLIIESVIEHIAHELARLGHPISAHELRLRNFYRSSDGPIDSQRSHLEQPLGRVRIREEFSELLETSEYEKRLEAVQEFNQANRWKKRGIAILPIKYGVGLKHIASMKSGNALVNVNVKDGSVTLLQGGVEMGQGLNQRVIQLAAHELRLPVSRFRMAPNNTDAIVNAPATAASSGFDINGGAVALACRKLRDRLLPVWKSMGKALDERGRPCWANDWAELVEKAFAGGVRISSGATYYLRTQSESPAGDAFVYYVYAYTASEVELDVLTGEHVVLRSDVLYDVGRTPSPAVDLGQIEGAFVQGLGLGTCEEVIHDAEGRLLTDNIWNYELPFSQSIPIDFRLALVETEADVLDQLEADGRIAVAGSKATGEPGLSTGNSVFMALRNAVLAARAEFGQRDWTALDAPATIERVRLAIDVPDEAFTS